MSAPIKVINVSKKYRINPGGLMDAINLIGRRLNPKSFGRDFSREIDEEREIWALKDVSFEVAKGEVLGIIGPNGAGKSTILKILSGITRPTRGRVDVRGRVGALIEVGAGFHNELTGRENVYMNGSILGMKKKEIDRKYKKIVGFAELGKFMDTPLKKYSSGMRVRLGFSVAVHLEPDVLLIDEVLSVGDINFRAKSAQRMMEFKAKSIPIIFISHSLTAISTLCDRVLLLKNGRIDSIGPTKDIIEKYIKDSDAKPVDSSPQLNNDSSSDDIFTLTRVELLNRNGLAASLFKYREDLTIRLHYRTERPIEAYFDISLKKEDRTIYAASMLMTGQMAEIEGEGFLDCVFKSIELFPGKYEVVGFVRDKTGVGILAYSKVLAVFQVTGSPEDYGFDGKLAAPWMKWYGAGTVTHPYEWRTLRSE